MAGSPTKPVHNQLVEVEQERVDQFRYFVLVRLTPLLALVAFVTAYLLPGSVNFYWAIAAMCVIWIGMITKKISFQFAQNTVVFLFGFLIWIRISNLAGLYAADANGSLFFGIYAFVPIYFTFIAVLYPYPRSAVLGAVAWIIIASTVTYLYFPVLIANPAREGLKATLIIIWLGYLIFLALINSFALSHARLTKRQALIAATARAAQQKLQEAVAQLEAMFSQAAVGIAIVDREGRWLQANQKLCEILNYSESELQGKSVESISHSDDNSSMERFIPSLCNHERKSFAREQRLIRQDRRSVWVNITFSLFEDPEQASEKFIVVVEDISSRKSAETALTALNADLEQRIQRRTAELQVSNQRWQDRNGLLNRITELIALLPSAQDEDEACRVATMYLPRIFQASSGVLFLTDRQSSHLEALGSWGHPQQSQAGFTPDGCWCLRRGQPHVVAPDNNVMRCLHTEQIKSGRAYACMPLSGGGETFGVLSVEWDAVDHALDGGDHAPDIVMLRTVSEQLSLALVNTRLRAKLEAQATKDPLTGLYNRRHLESTLSHMVAVGKRELKCFSLLIFDIDHFKRFNDEFGHDAGDLVITTVGGCLSRTIRDGDLAFRYGGEEFIAVLPSASQESAMICAERILAAIRTLRLTHTGRVLPQVTVSIGVAVFPADGANAESLLRAADTALYQAKQSGRNRMVLSSTMNVFKA